MNIQEKELEDVISEMILTSHCKLPTKMNYDYILRQFNLNGYGVPDIIGYSINEIINTEDERIIIIDVGLFELKRDKIDINTYTQSYRYAKGIFNYLSFISKKFNKYTDILINDFNIFNIGKTIDKAHECLCYLPDIIGNYHIYTYKFTMNGFGLENESGYSLIDNKFSRNYKDIQQSLTDSKYARLF